jgi:hypothetical protein
MGDTINPRVLDFVTRFINISHLFSPLPGKEHCSGTFAQARSWRLRYFSSVAIALKASVLLCGGFSLRSDLLKYPQDMKSVIEGAAFLV